MGKVNLSVIVPAFNEENIIENSIVSLIKTLDKLNSEYEIIIINDGSTDNTGIISNFLQQQFPDKIKVIHNKFNLMIGGAIMEGIKSAKYSNLIICPVDNPLSLEDFNMFLSFSDEYDIVVGFRRKREGYKLWMKFLSLIYYIFCKMIFVANFKDFTWISLYKKHKLLLLNPKFKGIAFFVEILIKAKRKKFKIKEIPCEMKPRTTGKPTVSKISRILHLFFETLNLWWHINFQRW
ncbi:MAG: glycosyltransferase family 2 protein [Endomicrobia bacterium]|nr:glycosyltransferase family 2 protein [Endomicrobiia bacterium]